jgi:hypothetical protein
MIRFFFFILSIGFISISNARITIGYSAHNQLLESTFQKVGTDKVAGLTLVKASSDAELVSHLDIAILDAVILPISSFSKFNLDFFNDKRKTEDLLSNRNFYKKIFLYAILDSFVEVGFYKKSTCSKFNDSLIYVAQDSSESLWIKPIIKSNNTIKFVTTYELLALLNDEAFDCNSVVLATSLYSDRLFNNKSLDFMPLGQIPLGLFIQEKFIKDNLSLLNFLKRLDEKKIAMIINSKDLQAVKKTILEYNFIGESFPTDVLNEVIKPIEN